MASTKPAIEGGSPLRETPLPFFRASIDEEDIAAVTGALRSGWLTVGPKTEELERGIATYLGVDHAVAVSSCSEAMFLSLLALGVGPGDEVITSALTFASTVHAIVHTGATPVLADIDTTTFGPDPRSVAARITDKTRALLPVHYGGQACRIEQLLELAAQHDLSIVEDAAHSFGAAVSGKRLGSFGDATTFSFYATKNITTGEGGAITCDDDQLAARLRSLSYHGMSRDSWTRYADRGSWYYQVEESGYKANLNDVLASLGLSQLGKAEVLRDRRTRIAEHYLARLADADFVELPAVAEGNTHSWHLFVVRLRPRVLRIDRDHFIRALTEENIGSSVHFIPIHHHPFFSRHQSRGDSFAATEDFFSRCISLPLYPGMSEEDCDDVVDALERIAAYYRA